MVEIGLVVGGEGRFLTTIEAVRELDGRVGTRAEVEGG